MKYDENGKLIDGRGTTFLTNPVSIAMRQKWSKGDHSGEKPRGNKKGGLHVGRIVKQWLKTTEKVINPITKQIQELTQEDLITLAQIKQARKGKTDAYMALMDRAYGKPVQTQNINVQPVIRARIVMEEEEENESQQDDSDIIISETTNDAADEQE